VAQDVWSHVFITYDGSSKAAGVTIYINGGAAPVEAHSGVLTDTIATSQPLRLGKRSTAFALNGVLADVRFYRRNLTAVEVKGLASEPVVHILRKSRKQRNQVQQELVSRLFRDRHGVN